MKSDKDRYAWARQAGMLSTIPFLMAVPPIAGLLIGRFLDRKFSTQPAFTIVFLVLGFAARFFVSPRFAGFPLGDFRMVRFLAMAG